MRTRPLRASAVALLATISATLTVVAAEVPPARAADGSCVYAGLSTTCTFRFTGRTQEWVVPAGVRSATFEVVGAAGGSGPADNPPGGRGGGVRAVVSLVPRSTLQINVGESGGSTWYGAGGWNGGGNGGAFSHSNIKNLPSSGGGGASDVRTSPYSLTSRFLVGGGGGGAGSWTTVGTQGQPGAGGAGGGSTGGGAGRGFQGQNGSGSLFGAGGGGGAAASPGSAGGASGGLLWGGCKAGTGDAVAAPGLEGSGPYGGTGGWLRDSLDGGDCDSGGFGGGGGGGFAGGGGGGGGISAGAGGGGGSGFGPATSTSLLGEPGADGVVRVTYLTPGTPTWVNLGGTMASPPAVAKQQGTGLVDSRQDVFYLDADSNVVHRPITTGLVGPPENLRGPTYPGTSRPGHLRFGSSLAAVSWSYGRLDLFGRGTDDALWHRWYDGAWSGWERLSEAGRLASSPTVASWAPGRLDVFARGAATGGLDHLAFQHDTGWAAWETLPGPLTTDPAAVSWGPGRIDVFAGADTPADDSLRQYRWDGRWGGWFSFSDILSSAPAVSSAGNGTLDVFYRDAAGGLSRRSYDGANGGWGPTQDAGNFNSPAGSEPAVTTLSTGLHLVFMRGSIGGLWVRVYA